MAPLSCARSRVSAPSLTIKVPERSCWTVRRSSFSRRGMACRRSGPRRRLFLRFLRRRPLRSRRQISSSIQGYGWRTLDAGPSLRHHPRLRHGRTVAAPEWSCARRALFHSFLRAKLRTRPLPGSEWPSVPCSNGPRHVQTRISLARTTRIAARFSNRSRSSAADVVRKFTTGSAQLPQGPQASRLSGQARALSGGGRVTPPAAFYSSG